jgi:ABC-type antimicrobial peptide transport system permease subunit
LSLKFFPLVWAGLWRRPARTIFTGLCITIAFLLLGLLEGVNAGFARAIEHSNREYLFTNPLARGGTPMPIGAETKIRALPGVKDINVRRFFTDAILASVLFTLAFITGNTLRQSLHDRIPEFAVLKAVGYKDVAVLVIAYAEALLLYIPFALVGLGIACLLAPLAPRDVGAVVVSFGVASIGLICAAVLALISVALPASKLARLPVVTALGRR